MADNSSIAFDRFRTDDIAAANAMLLSRESALNPPGARPEPSNEPQPEPVEQQAAPEASEKPTNEANPLPADARADADPKAGQPAANQQQNTETQNANGQNGKAQSAFAKDQQRLAGTWKQVNEEKARIAQERAAIQSERVRLQQEQAKLEQRRQGANKNKITPEVYDQSAAAARKFVSDAVLQLDGLRFRKSKFEEAGQYTEAAKLDGQIEALQKQAHVQEYQAGQFEEIAKNMRANPDLSGDALTKRNQEHLAHYTVEAAKKWPELAQNGSEFQKATAKAISILRQSGLDENDAPVLRYFAAEHVAAQSAAARVPAMERELAQLRARIKEFETNTTPGGGQTAHPNLRPTGKPASMEAEGEMLRQMAIAKGSKG